MNFFTFHSSLFTFLFTFAPKIELIMQILVDVVIFLLGLAAIVKGADWLTDGAGAIARRYNISTLVIGLTIVAFGSSAPEMVVSVVSALKHNTDMAIGNVVGSNIFNILAIMGATALVAPIKATRNNLLYDLPFLILSSVAIIITAVDSMFDPGTPCVISRSDGMMLLCIFAIFMNYTFAIARSNRSEGKEEEDTVAYQPMPMWKSILFVIVGLAGLVLGGDWLVDGASGIATLMGLSQSIIALTIVSIGTSAPEFAASLMAARKGDTAMALGNIVGSVVFNVFFVLGLSASIFPLTIGHITNVDLITLLASSIMLWYFCAMGKMRHTLTRTEGLAMVVAMILYYAYLIWNTI